VFANGLPCAQQNAGALLRTQQHFPAGPALFAPLDGQIAPQIKVLAAIRSLLPFGTYLAEVRTKTAKEECMSNTAQSLDKLWYTRCPVPTPLGLASQLGWFLDEFRNDGIGVFTLQEADEVSLRESHYDHHLTNSFRQGGNVPAIWARARSLHGISTRVIGLNWIDEYQGIVTLPGTGIHAVKDLKDRRLALPRRNIAIDHGRAGALRGFLVALETAGLSHKNVEFIDIVVDRGRRPFQDNARRQGGYAELFTALRAGLVDAIFVKGARGLQATHEMGARIVFDLRNHPYPAARANNGAPRPITVDETLLQTRPDIVKRFLARIEDVGSWAAAHPSETLAYVSRETHASEEWVRRAYGSDLHLRQDTHLNEGAVKALEAYKDFLFQWGFIERDFAVADWIESGPLADVGRRRRIKLA
jgi:ABC-type nitrate/sulfonate/bicarbonate transport system substrate-binding protein